MSDREFKVWDRRFKTQWNRPDRHDWYLMQIAALIDSFLSAKYVPPSEKKLEFGLKAKETEIEEMSEEEIAKWAEERSNMRLAQLQAQSAKAQSPDDNK